ncbi:flagellin [Methanococcus voltae]|uniref:Flagellin n=2 Tax=Methanococcus voltae TaxID=2188 RepID=A0A8J7S3B9_METVO|nr:flagellin [Methanococcus voltae]MBP2172371.1 flagellin FlaB [Methanococcus voltae]MBP2200673.1 flagellin FlaB [Methanococcus voltae]MCS3921398.1 flagellin FlaB [Methanococcus voltae PS]
MKVKEFMNNKKGATGVGTLIVFIAMVLVAAVAASVLINTSGFLQQKASSTGTESTEQVSTGLKIVQTCGKLNEPIIDRLTIYVTPSPGSKPVDLKNTKLLMTDGHSTATVSYSSTYFENNNKQIFDVTGSKAWNNGAILPEYNFGVIVIQDDDGSCTAESPVIGKGDMAVITINCTNLDLAPRTRLNGYLQSEIGFKTQFTYILPNAYDKTEDVVILQ